MTDTPEKNSTPETTEQTVVTPEVQKPAEGAEVTAEPTPAEKLAQETVRKERELHATTGSKVDGLRAEMTAGALEAEDPAQAQKEAEELLETTIEKEGSGSPLIDAIKDLIESIASIFEKDPDKKGKKDGRKGGSKGEKVDEGKSQKELPEGWPEAIDSHEFEYPDSPVTPRLGRIFHKSSDFGMRLHPTEKVMKHHDGIDLNIGSGTDDLHEPLYATVPLRVEWVGTSSGGGNGIRLVDPENPGEVFSLVHLDAVPPFHPGDVIDPGECLGKIGNSGAYTTGPHLHLEHEIGGQEVDPMGKFGKALRLV